MTDFSNIWMAAKSAFVTLVGFVYSIAIGASLPVGYVVMALWVVLLIYNHRRLYYLKNSINIDDDINVSYARDARLLFTRLILKIAAYALFIVGVSILWRNFLPISFEGAFRSVLPHRTP